MCFVRFRALLVIIIGQLSSCCYKALVRIIIGRTGHEIVYSLLVTVICYRYLLVTIIIEKIRVNDVTWNDNDLVLTIHVMSKKVMKIWLRSLLMVKMYNCYSLCDVNCNE